MKVRCGFVSNSSSTSYIIAASSSVSDDELKTIIIEKMLGVEEHSPFRSLSEDIANKIISELNDTFEREERDQYMLNCYDEDLIVRLRKKYPKICVGSASTDGDSFEQTLVDLPLNYEDDNFYINKEAGY